MQAEETMAASVRHTKRGTHQVRTGDAAGTGLGLGAASTTVGTVTVGGGGGTMGGGLGLHETKHCLPSMFPDRSLAGIASSVSMLQGIMRAQ